MALQIWLPLTDDTHNQGVHDCAVTNYGATLVSTDGVLGGCYKFNQENPSAGTKYMELEACMEDFLPDGGSFTMSVWYKMPSTYGPLHAAGALGFGFISTSDYQKSGLTIGVRTSGQLYIEAFTNGVSIDTPIVGTNQAFDVWNHFCVTYNKDTKIATGYVNGTTNSNWTITINGWSNYAGRKVRIGRSRQGGWEDTFPGWLNDVRIYDHCLSAKEVKELSRGLIAHYKLDSHKIREAVPFPYMNGNGDYAGAGFWQDGTGGTHSINTDKNYIFNKDQARSLKISNASTTKPYLAYVNSTQFNNAIASGGYRTFCAIIMDADGGVITGDRTICFPAYNARIAASGVPANYWTEIVPLGGGWYLCKQEGICQDGTDNMVGVFVQPGHSLYISEWHIENYATKMSDFGLYTDQTKDVMWDSSGYGRHGEHYSGTVVTVATSGGHYTSAIKNLTGYIGKAYVGIPATTAITFAWWANYDEFGHQTSGLFCTASNATNPTGHTENAVHMYDNQFCLCNSAGTYVFLNGFSLNEYLGSWHHFCLTYDNTTARFYVDGVQKASKALAGPLKPFDYIFLGYSNAGWVTRMCKCSMSDFRIYSTALSQADIQEMLIKPASIDNKGNVETYEFNESNSERLPIVWTSEYTDTEIASTGWGWSKPTPKYQWYYELDGSVLLSAYGGWRAYGWCTSGFSGEMICVDFDYMFTDLSNNVSSHVYIGSAATVGCIYNDNNTLDDDDEFVWKHKHVELLANNFFVINVRGVDNRPDYVRVKIKGMTIVKKPSGNIGASVQKKGITYSSEFKETSNILTSLHLPPGACVVSSVYYNANDLCTAKTVIRYDANGSGRDLMGYSAAGAGYWGVTAAGAWEPHGQFSYTNADITKLNIVNYSFSSATENGQYTIGQLASGYNPRGKHIYNVKLYKNGTLVRDYYPTKNASGEVGLFDMVSGIFSTATNGATIEREITTDEKANVFIDHVKANQILEI